MNQDNFAQDLLKHNGFRVTEIRLKVLQFLISSKKPVDVIQIQDFLAAERLSADTVTIYRMLDAFVEKKLLKKLDFHDRKFRYEFSQNDHHHVICENCGRVEDVPNCSLEEVEKQITQKQKFMIKRHALEFFGLCPDCQ